MGDIKKFITIESYDFVKDGIKDRRRVSEHGEVYTPENIVNDMLDLVSGEKDTKEFYEYTQVLDDGSEEIRKVRLDNLFLSVDSTFLEPACGNGNFLVAIIRRKLVRAIIDTNKNNLDIKYEVFKAFATTYGIDILKDNIVEAKQRMLEEIIHNKELIELLNKNSDEDLKKLVDSINYVMDKNIILGDFLLKTYLKDDSRNRKDRINEGLGGTDIKIYNWKNKDNEFNKDGNIDLGYAYLKDIETDLNDEGTKVTYFLDFKIRKSTKRKREKSDDLDGYAALKNL